MKTTSGLKGNKKFETIEDYVELLNRKCAELDRIDVEDQASYKIADMTLRTTEAVKGVLETRMKADLFIERRARIIEGVTDNDAVLRKLKSAE